ncbi:MAG: hypothetical protein ACKOX4_05280, partial [Bacteroidota bacterium]
MNWYASQWGLVVVIVSQIPTNSITIQYTNRKGIGLNNTRGRNLNGQLVVPGLINGQGVTGGIGNDGTIFSPSV